MTITENAHPPISSPRRSFAPRGPASRAPALRATALTGLALAATLALVSCGGAPSTSGAPGTAGTEGANPSASHAASADDHEGTEAESAQSRLVITHDGGMTVLDTGTGKAVANVDLKGFNRVNPAGDGRHVLVSTTGGFQVLDAGTWSEPHGEHHHYFTGTPALEELKFPATTPGHAVNHGGVTALFDDGTGTVNTFTPSELGGDSLPPTQEYKTSAAHHGVAVQLANSQMLITEGTSESRNGAKLLAAPDAKGARAVLAESSDCPGVHGEATAKGEALVLGCEDGLLLIKDATFTKIASPDAYGRIGNQAGSDASTVVLGDYKKDKNAELERPKTFSLTDTATGKLTLVPIDYSYSFRSLARGGDGAALMLGTDGKLHIYNPETGKESAAVDIVAPWEEPLDWQQPRPAIFADGTVAYVSDPAKKLVHTVDLASAKVSASYPLDHIPNEITGVSGEADAAHAAH
ncbi:zinc metallochaperone AztD [Arthrobacter sp. BF1]|uniref:zinc metallochaperone AztD n=1 Tax=Arthrobacter sp. BF1 TaxID=2821145 RepID=UPI00211A30EC|nr:zinc metallochaperone AztD [Arthrobacter sp. BF1]